MQSKPVENRSVLNKLACKKTHAILLTIILCFSPIPAAAETYMPGELEIVFYQLSFIESANCLEILTSIGYNVGVPGFPVGKDDLPAIFPLPDSQNISIVGSGTLDQVGDGAPQQRIGIIYHRSQAHEYSALLQFINEQIDIQATQVQIEAMVVELTEEGIRELGIEYDLQKDYSIDAARRERSAVFDEAGFFGLRFMRFTEEEGLLFEAQLRALVRDRVAEVLSSPSVLTLDNRHAKIEIMKEVPVIEKSDHRTVDRWDIDIRYEEVGIILNIKPRVDRTGEWVTLQVQTEVSEDLDYLEIEGEKVAPIMERRNVETISRIRNNHPFIVGGLIREDQSVLTKKVPLLGKIPFLGRLFQTRQTVQEKREVIIVLTPRVIRPEASDRPVMPKDSETFDFFDTHLFRETYSLKAEDVYDLDFILDRPEIKRVLQEARHYIDRNPEAAKEPPFNAVAEDSIPGEETIVNRMLYNIVRKLNLFQQIDADRLIFFTPDDKDPAGFSVNRLVSQLQKTAGDLDVDEYLEKDYPKDVLYMTFKMPDHDGADTDIDYPIGNVKIEHQETAEAAEKRLYELGRLEDMTRPRVAFMISDQRELERLKTAIVVREILEVNDPQVIQRLANFEVGRRIAIPEVDPARERSFLIDRGAAKPFYMSHFYYAEFEEKFRVYIDSIREKLAAKEEN